MPSSLARSVSPDIVVRRGEASDLDPLMALERGVFDTDQLSRRSMRRLLESRSAEVIVAAEQGGLVGAAVVLFRRGSPIARLYSLGVSPPMCGRGVAAMLLQAVDACVVARGCTAIRLEVHQFNAKAIARYGKSGYRPLGRRRAYYKDGGDALRLEKRLRP
jgi:ribosomal protein S18 acetylase RimI-like enzyme